MKFEWLDEERIVLSIFEANSFNQQSKAKQTNKQTSKIKSKTEIVDIDVKKSSEINRYEHGTMK